MRSTLAAAVVLMMWAGAAPAAAQPSPLQIRAFGLARDALAAQQRADPGLWFTEMLGLAYAQVDAGDVEGARATRALMLEQTATLEDQKERDDQYRHVARLEARAGSSREALAACERIGVAERKIEALQLVAAAHAEAGRLDDARAALAHIPVGESRAGGVEAAMRGAAENGFYDVARALAQALADPVARSRVEYMIAWSAAKAGRFADARSAIARLASAETRLDTLFALAQAQREKKDPEARQTLHEAAAAWRETAPSFSHEIYAKILTEELSKADAFTEALALIPSAPETNRAELYQLVSADQAWSGAYVEAAATLERIDRSDAWRVDQGRATILAARVAAGLEPPDALTGVADPSLRETLQLEAAQAARERRDEQRARELLQHAARSAAASSALRDDRDDSLIATAEEQIAQGLLADARETIAAMRAQRMRSDALRSLANAYAERGERANAAAAFKESREAGRVLAADDYAFIVEEMARAGLLAEALAAARALPSGDSDRDWARQRTLRAVAETYAKAGHADEALAIAREIAMPIHQVLAYIEIAAAETP